MCGEFETRNITVTRFRIFHHNLFYTYGQVRIIMMNLLKEPVHKVSPFGAEYLFPRPSDRGNNDNQRFTPHDVPLKKQKSNLRCNSPALWTG